jgi:hypothetical protein
MCEGRMLVKAPHPYYLYHENLFFVNAVNRNEGPALAAFHDYTALHILCDVSQLPVAGAKA